jgi:CHAT domain-containing protein/Tfp pilus assembly protein PilF
LDSARTVAADAASRFASSGSAPDPAWERKFRLLEAEVAVKQGHPADALELLGRMDSSSLKGDGAIKALLIRSLSHHLLGREEESQRELDDARNRTESGRSPLADEVIWMEGIALVDGGRESEAAEKFQKSLLLARENGDVLVQASDLVNISKTKLDLQRYDEALVAAQEAVRFAESVGARKQVLMGLGVMGWAFVNLGDFEQALHCFKDAERQAADIGLTDARLLWLQDAGFTEQRLGHLEDALYYDEEALRIASTLPSAKATDQIVNVEANLAQVLAEQGRYDEAGRHADRALTLSHHSNDPIVIAYPWVVRGMIAARQGSLDAAERLDEAWKRTPDPETRMEIENTLANWYRDQHRAGDAESWYRRSIDTFEHNRAAIGDEALRLSAFEFGDKIYRDYVDFLVDRGRSSEALDLLDRSRARTLDDAAGARDDRGGAVRARIADPRSVAQRLHATLLIYSLGPTRSHLWAVRDRAMRHVDLPPRAAIAALLERHQRSIDRSMDPLQTGTDAANSLYSMLIEPAAALIAPGANVVVIPDGPLYALNFETLIKPDAEHPHYWIDDATVTTASSIRLLGRSLIPDSTATPRELLLIGDPVAQADGFQTLPNAGAEIARIGGHFAADAQTVVVRSEAVPDVFSARQPQQYRYIHFVAHAMANRLRPLESAVILSPAKSGEFKLYARDVLRQRLHARLVTISACNGAGLRTYAGEGTVGLAWAFLRAGAHNVIGALWPVDDAATPLLMDRMYGELAAGRAPESALRSAKLALLHSGTVYRKPYYWGAFQLYAGS